MVNDDALAFELVSAAGEVIDLSGRGGIKALSGLTGTGFAEVIPRRFEGAGDGATWRGARVSWRTVAMPIVVKGADRAEVLERLGTIARVTNPHRARPLLRMIEPDGTAWFVQVARVGAADWVWDGNQTDARTRVRTDLTFEAGDPYFTREDASSFEVKVSTAGRGLLPKLASLRLTSSQAMGSRTVENPGDAEAYPVWKITGPGSNFTATSATGEVLRWEGSLAVGESLMIDTQAGTVLDATGANRYDQMSAAPRFWSIEPGTSTVSVTLDGATVASRITASWRPRRWVSF